MTEHLNDRSDPHKPVVVINDRVVVRDDFNLAGVTMLGVLVAITLAAGALIFALSGPHDTTASLNAPTSVPAEGVVGQRQREPVSKAE